jgi:hypothetical protein
MSDPTKEEIEDWKQHYQTPFVLLRWIESVILPLHGHSRFTLDCCATPWNARCERYITSPGTLPDPGMVPCEGMVGVDGLVTSWATEGAAWCNAGFGKLAPWFGKAVEEKQGGQLSCLPSHGLSGERWVQDFIDGGASVCYLLRPRVDWDEDPRFMGWLESQGKDAPGNPKNSMLWVFDPAMSGPCVAKFAPRWPKPERRKKL